MNKDTLELSPEEMRALGYRVVDLLADHFANLAESRVGTKGDPAVLRPLMRKPPPAQSVSPDEIFETMRRDIFSNMMNVGHPRHFAFVPVPSNFVSVMADALSSGFNVFSGSWLAGSGSVALELARRIAEDRAAGLRPFAIVANAGTTNTGAIDPLPEIAALSKANDLWMHVDGAYGAAAVLCDRGRGLLKGLDLADSLS